MKTIPLTRGKVAIIDDADYAFLKQWKWFASPMRSNYSQVFYAMRGITIPGNKRRLQMMHRLILGLRADDKRQSDHRDGNGLNNQRGNLRICTAVQNQRSARKRTVGTSQYKGVQWFARDRKWYSHIQVEKKLIHLGCFDSEIDAAITYDNAALKHFGEFAMTNEALGLL